jgi:hypothetical protein
MADEWFRDMHTSMREIALGEEEVELKVKLATEDVTEFESKVVKRHLKGKGIPCHWTGSREQELAKQMSVN